MDILAHLYDRHLVLGECGLPRLLIVMRFGMQVYQRLELSAPSRGEG